FHETTPYPQKRFFDRTGQRGLTQHPRGGGGFDSDFEQRALAVTTKWARANPRNFFIEKLLNSRDAGGKRQHGRDSGQRTRTTKGWARRVEKRRWGYGTK